MAAAESPQMTAQFYNSVLCHMPEDVSLQITQCLYWALAGSRKVFTKCRNTKSACLSTCVCLHVC